MHNIAVFVGSLRRDSINLKLATALGKLAADKMTFNIVKLDDVPMYNEDLWENPPASVLRMKKDIEAADAVLFVTPEYNRSIPPVIKNAIDWGTRPWGKNSWAGKAGGIIGTSPGAAGTAVVQSHLRSLMPVLEIAALGQPEVYFTYKEGIVDADHNITDEKSKAFLAGYVAKFDAWISKHKA